MERNEIETLIALLSLEQSKNRGETECKQGKTELVEIDILISGIGFIPSFSLFM
jgi:hypothetical protein